MSERTVLYKDPTMPRISSTFAALAALSLVTGWAAQAATPTTTVLVPSPNPAVLGTTVALSATVAPSAASGTVGFFDSGVFLGSAPLAGGSATFNTAQLQPGKRSLRAVYSGDERWRSALSPPWGFCIPCLRLASNHCIVSSQGSRSK